MRTQLSFLLPLALVCLAVGSSKAADDPFVGKWKVNLSKSKVVDEMKVEGVGENKYAFAFGPGAVDTIVADGTDQQAQQGTTLSVTVEGPNIWKVVRKKDGRKLLSAIWTLSADGTTLDDAFTGYQADGSAMNVHYRYQRAERGSGFTGTWDSVSVALDPSIELAIQPYEGDGLSFASRGLALVENIRFDGKDHTGARPGAPPGATFSGRRVSQFRLEITGKMQGKVAGTRQIELSEDRKTLTMTVRVAGEKKPQSILVFDRG